MSMRPRISLVPDETALAVWKRVQESGNSSSSYPVVESSEMENPGFADSFNPSYAVTEPPRPPSIHSLPLRLSNNQVQELKFHESVDIQAIASEVPEIVLNVALEFASRFDSGVVIHISTGNNLYRSLQKSGVDLTNVPLYKLHRKGKVKGITVLNIVHFLAVLEILRQSLRGETALILCEELLPLLLAQKGLSGTIPPASQINAMFKAINQIQQMHTALIVWVNTSIPKSVITSKDPFFLLWRQRIPKHIQY